MSRLSALQMIRLMPGVFAKLWRRPPLPGRKFCAPPADRWLTVAAMVDAAPDLFQHGWQRAGPAPARTTSVAPPTEPSFAERHLAALATKTSSLPPMVVGA